MKNLDARIRYLERGEDPGPDVAILFLFKHETKEMALIRYGYKDHQPACAFFIKIGDKAALEDARRHNLRLPQEVEEDD